MDELNEYLEYTCVRCDDGKSQYCDCDNKHPQAITYEDGNNTEYNNTHLNDWG